MCVQMANWCLVSMLAFQDYLIGDSARGQIVQVGTV